MKTLIKLCCSIVRKNKGFTAGIFIMSALSAAIAFLGANFGVSSSDTVMGFLAESGTPDAVYVTEPLSADTREEIGAIDGVAHVSPGFLYDTNIETGNGDLYSVRLFRMDADSLFVNTVHEKAETDGTAPGVEISSEFAAHNNIHPGDRIRVDSPFGKKELTVTATVSNPETMNCVRDEMSAYESYQFGYLYLHSGDFAKLFPLGNTANRWLIDFAEGLSADGQKECMREIRAVLGSRLISETLTEESEALNSIRDDLRTIRVLCGFIPGVIWLISLGFNFIFIKIIVENQRKTIGLLRALGFSGRRVVSLFAAYTVLVNLPALLAGIPAGVVLLRKCLGLIAEAEGILTVTVTVLPGMTAGMLLMVFVIGIAAALLSAETISKIDPVEAYGGTEFSSFEPPEWIGSVKTDPFFKISLVSLLRNGRRQIIGALCIAACIISMCIGFEGVLTIGHPIDAVFGGRYRYDLMVRNIDEDTVSEIRNNVRSVTAVEPTTFFSAEMFGKDVRVSTVTEDSTMTVLTDASGERIFPGDGVILDEMSAKMHGISVGDAVELAEQKLTVTGIAREILYPVMYVSPRTAARAGYAAPNCALLKLDADTPVRDAQRQITELSGDAYLVNFALQKENIRDGFRAMRAVMLVFAILAFCIGSLLVLNITVIDYNENRLRYATLRALGTPVGRLGTVAVVQNLFRVALGILIAFPLCRVCVSVLLQLLSGASQQYVMVRYAECLLLSCLIPLLYVLLGTELSLRKIRKMDFCGSLNETE